MTGKRTAQASTRQKSSQLTEDGEKYLAERLPRGTDVAKAARARKITSLSPAETQTKYGKKYAALDIPYYTAEGKRLLNFHTPFTRARLFKAPKKLGKFAQRKDTLNHIYLDPARKDWPAIQRDPAITIIIAEGESRGWAGTERGIPVIAIGGVWAWRTCANGKSSPSVPLPELDEWEWGGRQVLLVFDSDIRIKPPVRFALCGLARELRERGAIVREILLPDGPNGEEGWGLDDYLVDHTAEDLTVLPQEEVRPIVSASSPAETAEQMLGMCYTDRDDDGEVLTLRRWVSVFYRYVGTHYTEVEDEAVRSQVYSFLEECLEKKGEDVEPFQANRSRVDNVLDALRAKVLWPVHKPLPTWVDNRDGPDPADLIALRNGLLHLPSRKLLPHTPLFFGLNAAACNYDPRERAPQWAKFLDSVFPDDKGGRDTLQEVMGYLLTQDTRQQKIFSFIGPKRSGKGTIARVLRELIGEENVCNPSSKGLGTDRFGLEPLLGKQLATLGDARVSGRDGQALAERLLSISGEDAVDVDRKFIRARTSVKLSVRFLLISNQVPRVIDVSGALASRFVIITFKESFYGREDHSLDEKLNAELPGILNWALDGLDRLRKRGHFVQPTSSAETLRLLEDLSAPIKAFLRDCCEIKPDAFVTTTALYDAWCLWCRVNGHGWSGSKEEFGRDLRAAEPKITHVQKRIDRKKAWVYGGVALQASDTGAGRMREKIRGQ